MDCEHIDFKRRSLRSSSPGTPPDRWIADRRRNCGWISFLVYLARKLNSADLEFSAKLDVAIGASSDDVVVCIARRKVDLDATELHLRKMGADPPLARPLVS
jgi:hypothetical protein